MAEYVSPLSGIAQGLQQSISNVTNLSTLFRNAQQIRQQQELFPLQKQQAELALKQTEFGVKQNELALEREKMAHSLSQAQLSQLLAPFDPTAHKDHPLYAEENVNKFNTWFDNVQKWLGDTPYRQYYVTHDNKPTMFAWQTFKQGLITDPKELEGAITTALIEKTRNLQVWRDGLMKLDEQVRNGRVSDDYAKKKQEYTNMIQKLEREINLLQEQRKNVIDAKTLATLEAEKTKALYDTMFKNPKYVITQNPKGGFQAEIIFPAGQKTVVPVMGMPIDYAKKGEGKASPKLKSHVTKVQIPGRIGTFDAAVIPIQYFTDETTGQNYIRDKNNQLIPVSSNVVLEFLKMNYPQVADRYIESLGGGTFGKSRGSGGSKTYEDKQKRFRVTIEQ